MTNYTPSLIVIGTIKIRRWISASKYIFHFAKPNWKYCTLVVIFYLIRTNEQKGADHILCLR